MERLTKRLLTLFQAVRGRFRPSLPHPNFKPFDIQGQRIIIIIIIHIPYECKLQRFLHTLVITFMGPSVSGQRSIPQIYT